MRKKHYQRTKMNNTLKILTLLLFLFINFTLPLSAAVNLNSSNNIPPADSAAYKTYSKSLMFPVPPADHNRLFYIQRSSNINTLIYDLNIDKKTGKPDTETPVHPYWIRYNEKGQKEELNYIQRKFAYGLTTKPLGGDRYDIRFVSYKKFPLTLMKGADGKYHIFASVAQKQIMLNYVFIKIEGGSFWLPNVIYVELKGIAPATGKEITERFKP
ncbi:MAG: CDP-alcohol phosphatidyltransferase [Mucilaginibacter sp.]|nr:CDP-alcohol phosphatidyltransferase [Mucilaginibacter sp.]